ncbi:hypothetical protein DUI87_03476 [Hirundo rustica rustica]|uniref:Reverse transcriptase RNase H-like domain-containing protein n=1 Tax=Hirundo rustica rustica TaxID=333673 RepID=A0A3M0LA81_HIRRU|nr:hypothetical protein DUI87_03476 [Hirundo rustica rustica]
MMMSMVENVKMSMFAIKENGGSVESLSEQWLAEKGHDMIKLGYKNSPTIFGEQLAKDLESWEPPPGEGQLLQYVDDLLIATRTQETCMDWTQGIALGILAQNLGPYRRAVAYLSKQLDTAAKGWPGCLRAVAAVAINIQEARKFTLGRKMTVLVSHTVSAVLEAKGGHWLSPQRFLKYQAILVEQDDVEIVVTNIVNPASFLRGVGGLPQHSVLMSMGEPVIHDCLETIEATYSSRPDLKDTRLRMLRPGLLMEAAMSSVEEGMLGMQLPQAKRLKIEGCAIRGYDIYFNITQVCTEYHKNQTKITPPVPRKAVIIKMPAIPEVEEQITPVVTKIGPYAIKKTGVQKLIVNPKWS